MHILLINTNPVISRLLALCTRDESIILEEVSSVSSLRRKQYDIVFVDEESYKDEILDMDRYISTAKKILFSNENVQLSPFEMTIQKPFLPSEIIALLDSVEENDVVYEKSSKQGFIFPLATETIESDREANEVTQVLDADEIEKIKTLLDMEEDTESDLLNEDDIEARKIEVIKEQLIADGLEIVDENEIVDELSMQDTIKIFDIHENENSNKNKKIKQSKEKKRKSPKKKKNIKYTEAQRVAIEDAVQVAIGKLKRKKMKKLLKGKEVKLHIQLEAKA